MSDPDRRCTTPRILGERLQRWMEVRFKDLCHEHDKWIGNYHPKVYKYSWVADWHFCRLIAGYGRYRMKFNGGSGMLIDNPWHIRLGYWCFAWLAVFPFIVVVDLFKWKRRD